MKLPKGLEQLLTATDKTKEYLAVINAKLSKTLNVFSATNGHYLAQYKAPNTESNADYPAHEINIKWENAPKKPIKDYATTHYEFSETGLDVLHAGKAGKISLPDIAYPDINVVLNDAEKHKGHIFGFNALYMRQICDMALNTYNPGPNGVCLVLQINPNDNKSPITFGVSTTSASPIVQDAELSGILMPMKID